MYAFVAWVTTSPIRVKNPAKQLEAEAMIRKLSGRNVHNHRNAVIIKLPSRQGGFVVSAALCGA
jgi:hypothetical protein